MKNIIIVTAFFLIISLQSQNKIEKIEFSTEGYASAPDYKLVIYCNRTVVFNALNDNYKIPVNAETVGYGTNDDGVDIRGYEIKGLFISRLSSKLFKEISNLIQSLDEEFTNEKYFETSIHASVGGLKVTYKDGKESSIYDYGMKGTERLIKLYKFFDDLRFSQKWK